MEKVKVFTEEFFSNPLDAEHLCSTRHDSKGTVVNDQLTVFKDELSNELFSGIDHLRPVNFNIIGNEDGYNEYYFVYETADGYVFQTRPSS